jgi:hypothetical protein
MMMSLVRALRIGPDLGRQLGLEDRQQAGDPALDLLDVHHVGLREPGLGARRRGVVDLDRQDTAVRDRLAGQPVGLDVGRDPGLAGHGGRQVRRGGHGGLVGRGLVRAGQDGAAPRQQDPRAGQRPRQQPTARALAGRAGLGHGSRVGHPGRRAGSPGTPARRVALDRAGAPEPAQAGSGTAVSSSSSTVLVRRGGPCR